MKYTIIIPTYNSADFIKIPLDSLEKQTYNDNFQVLIVNDGSTDDIKNVLKKYLKRNKNWEVINKKNGNWGSVINYVKKKNLIKGKYVTILDSDDYFKSDILDIVKNYDTDIIVTGIIKKEKGKENPMPIFFTNQTKHIKKERAFTPVSTPHGKFYKKELFMKMVDLEEGIAYQDTVLYNDLVSKSSSIMFIAKPLAVWWRDREGNSTTAKWNLKRATTWLETCQRIVNLPKAHNEVNSWTLMYLWELRRYYKGEKIPFKININTKKAKFKWLPFGLRKIAKMYFLTRTKKFRN